MADCGLAKGGDMDWISCGELTGARDTDWAGGDLAGEGIRIRSGEKMD